jgi:putative aldouronate transport system permease protein
MTVKDTSPGAKAFNAFNTALMVFIMLVTLYPLLYTVSISLSDVSAVLTNQITFFPKGINLKAYEYALAQPAFWSSYRNTVVYTVLGTSVNLYLTCSLAFAMSRRELVFRKGITLLVILTMYFQGGMISRFLVFRTLGLYNNIWAMIIPFAITTYNLVVVRTFMQGIPEEIFESAKLDGYNELQIFFLIVLPLSKATIATIGLFYAVSHWNSYFWPMVLLSSSGRQPLQVLLRNMIAENNQMGSGILDTEVVFRPSYEMIIAASIVVAIIPILCVYPFIQRYFVKGVMVGSLKG